MDLLQENCIEPNSKLFRAHIVVINSTKTLPVNTNVKSFNNGRVPASNPPVSFFLVT